MMHEQAPSPGYSTMSTGEPCRGGSSSPASPGALLAVMAGRAGSVELAGQFSMLSVIEPIPNPLAAYPNRDWERVYRKHLTHRTVPTTTCACRTTLTGACCEQASRTVWRCTPTRRSATRT